MERPLDEFHQRFSNICQHVQRTNCNKCVYKQTKSSSEVSDNIEVTCPEPQCPGTFTLQQVQEQIGTENNLRSNDNREENNQSPERKTEFIWCAHDRCGSGQFHVLGQSTTPIVT
jgi:hypothetical protein